MNKKQNITWILTALICSVVVYYGCNKDEGPPPENPFDDIDWSDTASADDPWETSEFTGLHKDIFAPKCATPGCHDGAFEPDFRSVMSSYATLVYHPIVKNNAAEDFLYRVVPFNKEESVLYERITNCCFVNIDDRMPQDNIGQPLPDADIQAIGDWIMNGARDMLGTIPQFPNTEPNVLYYYATSTDFQTIYSQDRIDSIPYNPFIVPNNTDLRITVVIEDDSTAVEDLQVNQLRISSDPDDFSSVQTFNAYYFGFGGNDVWIVDLNTGNLTAGQILYMRYYVNDGDNPINTEFPDIETNDFYKTFWALRVTP